MIINKKSERAYCGKIVMHSLVAEPTAKINPPKLQKPTLFVIIPLLKYTK